MAFQSRLYAGEKDLHQMIDFVIESRSIGGPRVYYQLGDLLWQFFRWPHAETEPEKNIRLWLDENEKLAGFAWFFPPKICEMQLHPHTQNTKLEPEMIAWVEEKARDSNQSVTDTTTLMICVHESDRTRIALLEAQSFVHDEFYLVHTTRSLHIPIDEPILSDGFVVRHIQGKSELENRIGAARESFERSRMTVESYSCLRKAPGFIPELDLIAIAPDGACAAFAIGWIDPVNKIGYFEPVGTRRSFQRQGLGKAVLSEGLKRMRALGAEQAVVLHAGSNPAAQRLYESVGFRPVHKFFYYSKKF